MPLNFKLLEANQTSDESLAALMTASMDRLGPDATDAAKTQMQDLCRKRKILEDIIASRIDEGAIRSLSAAHLHGAVDLAWDSSTITKHNIPLVMYAQRRIDTEKCISALKQSGGDRFVRVAQDGKKEIDLPKFTEVSINLVRSIITRRVAAQSARFTNLYPFFKYEGRGTSEIDKLRADVLSQRMDIMSDQYGYRPLIIQCIRDMLMYPFCIAFPAAKWDREVEWYDADMDRAEELQSQQPEPKSRVRREGVPIILPHASRVFYDTSHPVSSINSDSGCEYFGFWDVVRFGSIVNNANYFNLTAVAYDANRNSWFSNHSSYFTQYYTTITPYKAEQIGANNDRKSGVGEFSQSMLDSSVFITHVYMKLIPNQWGFGKYPFPVWVHFVVVNSRDVIAAEIMPDCPGFVFAYNNSSQRLINLSMAHELMPFQDQLSNLFSQLLECANRDAFGIAMLNLDAFPVENADSKKTLEEFRDAMRGKAFFSKVSTMEVSITKMKELGVDLNNIFTVVRQPPNTGLNTIIKAIGDTIMMAERVMALSPQEQGQQSPRETSATEVQIIAGTTENIYQFISDAVDEGRSAMKRYLYNALISLGTEDIYLPVVSRYRREVAEKAGFTIENESDAAQMPSDAPRQFTVVGKKRNLVAEYVFNSRDGAERASNIQGAQTLVQMLGVLMQPAVLSMLTKEKLADIINTIIRQSGAGVDVMVEPAPGEGGSPVLGQTQAVPGAAPTAIPDQVLQGQIPRA
jgi:hypothetical protein